MSNRKRATNGEMRRIARAQADMLVRMAQGIDLIQHKFNIASTREGAALLELAEPALVQTGSVRLAPDWREAAEKAGTLRPEEDSL